MTIAANIDFILEPYIKKLYFLLTFVCSEDAIEIATF